MARPSKKKDRTLHRSKETRQWYDKVLIVCEGECTEPNYLLGLKKHKGLSSVNIQIEHTDGKSAPKYVVEKAIELRDETLQNPNREAHYDRVYCVFDRDQHSTFHQALNRLNTYRQTHQQQLKDNKQSIEAICSYPSFEYWYLCHFEYSRAEITAQECEKQVNQQWQQHFKQGYQKNSRDIYQKLLPYQQSAIKNAKQAETDAQNTGQDNPSTQVHHLVSYLLDIDKK